MALVKVLPGDLVQVPANNGLKVYSVKSYGALGDGSTDDTTAIQAAINAVATAGGGTVYFPNGVYIVGGALQDTGGANAQLTLPSVSAPGTQQYTVRLLGETPPSQIPWYLGGGNTPSSGVVIKSTLSSGNGALLGGYGPVGSFQNFTNITVVVENINFRMVANPTNSCLNFYYVNSAVLKNIVVDSGNWIGSTVTQPTTATSYGVKMPQNNNGGNNRVDQLHVIGFYTDYLDGEHVVADQIELYAAIYAAEFQTAGFPSRFDSFLYHNCTNGLRWTGTHAVSMVLRVEHTDQAAWYATTYDIVDASNLGRGAISFVKIKSNVGYQLTLSRNGGNNLLINCLNSGQVPFTTFLGNDLDGDASVYTNGSYLALNSKPGANPLYLNFRNTNASATVDFFNGNAVVSQPGNLTLAGLTASSFLETDSSKVLVSKTAAQMRTDLSLVIGTNVQAYDADLDTWAAITPASGVGTFLATPSSANLISAVTDETGTGSLVFATSPALTGPITTTGTPGSTGLFNVSGDTASNPLLFVDNYKSSGALSGNTITFRAARGTSDSPSAVQNGDFLWSISTIGYGTNAYSVNRLSLSGLASENWTNSAQGAYLSVRATLAGGTTTSEGARLGYSSSGVFMLGFPTLSATANSNIYTDTNYLVLNSKNGANPLYLNFDNSNASATVNFHNGTFVVSQPGKVTKYNNITTVSSGVPSEVATIDSTGLTANVGASTLYAVPSSGAGLYRVSAYLVTTTAASVSSTMPNAQVVYTDSDSNTSVTLDVSPILGAAGLGQSGLLTANVVGTVFSGTVVIYVKASTTIQYQTVNYASTAAGMAYALRMKLEAL